MRLPTNRFHFAFADAVVVKEKLRDIEIGSVSSAPFGTPPAVSVRQSDEHILMDFVIPKGKDGEDGQDGQSYPPDSQLSSTSTNPVQNKVVKAAIDRKIDAPVTTPRQGQVLAYDGNTTVWASNGKYISSLVVQKDQVDGIADHSIGDVLEAYNACMPISFRTENQLPCYLSVCEAIKQDGKLSQSENYDVTNRAERPVPATITKQYEVINRYNAAKFGAVAAHNVFLDGYVTPNSSAFISTASYSEYDNTRGDTKNVDLLEAVELGFRVPYIAFRASASGIKHLNTATFDIFCEINPSTSNGYSEIGIFVSDSLDIVNEIGDADLSRAVHVQTIGSTNYVDYRMTPLSVDLSSALSQLGHPSEMYVFVAMISTGIVITGHTNDTLSGFRTNYGARFFGFDLVATDFVDPDWDVLYNVEFRSITSNSQTVIRMSGNTLQKEYTVTTEPKITPIAKRANMTQPVGVDSDGILWASSGGGLVVNITSSGGTLSADCDFATISQAVTAGAPVTVIYSSRLYRPATFSSNTIYFVADKYYMDVESKFITINTNGYVGEGNI